MSNPPSTRPQAASPELIEWGIDLAEIVSLLLNEKWKIAGITLGTTFLFLLYAFLATPIYEVDAVIQIEETKTTSADELSPLFASTVPVEAEAEIVTSRLVLGQVVNELGLTVEIENNYFPIIGGFLARRFKPEKEGEIAEPWLWFSSYAWGGEKLHIASLDVPQELMERDLELIAAEDGNYSLFDDDDNLLVSGKVGKPAQSNGVSILVDELHARPETEFNIRKKSWYQAILDLQAELTVEELVQDTQLLHVVLDGEDRAFIRDIVNSIVSHYLDQNIKRNAQEAQSQLDFLRSYLPEMKEKMDQSQRALNEYMSRHSTLSMDQETQILLDLLIDNEKQVQEAELALNSLLQSYRPSHPTVQAAREKLAKLRSLRAGLDQRVGDLPAQQSKLVELARDAQVDQDMYSFLMNKMQDLQLLKASSIGNARVIDHAVIPDKPVEPDKLLCLILGFIAGLAMGMFYVLLKDALSQGVSDFSRLEKETGLPVFAVIPHSRKQEKISARLKDANRAATLDVKGRILAWAYPQDLAVESLRSVRTSLHFRQAKAPNNLVLIAGPSPSVGKSFLSANLAAVMADAGSRVLLIDGDLRKGHLQDYMAVSRSPGVVEVLLEEVPFEKAISEIGEDGRLSLLPRGRVVDSPSELLLSQNFARLLEAAKKAYDLVIIDSAPILACTDAALIAEHAGVRLLNFRAEINTRREIEQALTTLRHIGLEFDGMVANDVRPKSGLKGYGQYGYHYQYHYNN